MVKEEAWRGSAFQETGRLGVLGCRRMSWELEQAAARLVIGAAPAVGGGDFIGPLGVWFPFKCWSPGQRLCCLQKAPQNERRKVWTRLCGAPRWQGCG